MAFVFAGKSVLELIEGKLSTALTTGSLIGLWLTSFLAVYREGAETVLFYYALVGDAKSAVSFIYLSQVSLSAQLFSPLLLRDALYRGRNYRLNHSLCLRVHFMYLNGLCIRR